jgi:hypothetical protein
MGEGVSPGMAGRAEQEAGRRRPEKEVAQLTTLVPDVEGEVAVLDWGKFSNEMKRGKSGPDKARWRN